YAATRPLGTALETVTVTESEVLVLPPVSRATAVRTWSPFEAVVVSQLTEYGAAGSSAPRALPSGEDCTAAAAWSADAAAVTAMVPETPAAFDGLVMPTVGRTVSAVTLALASPDGSPTLPAASSAATL